MTKQCKKCSKIKSLSEFSKSTSGSLGRVNVCKACHKLQYQATKDHRIKVSTEYGRLKKEEFNTRTFTDDTALNFVRNQLLGTGKQRASKHGIEFSIGHSDVMVPLECPILGIPLLIGEEVITDNSPTLDRLDPSKGYVSGNVQVISNLANRIKTSATGDQVMLVAQWMKKHGL